MVHSNGASEFLPLECFELNAPDLSLSNVSASKTI